MEATGNWPHIAEQLEEVVEELVLAHPQRVKAIASARVKNKIQAILIKRGLRPPVGDVFGQRGRLWLAAQEMPAVYGKAIASYLTVLDGLEEEIAQVTPEIDSEADDREQAGWLRSIPGIGRHSALLIPPQAGRRY